MTQRTQEERDLEERTRILDERGRLFGLVMPKNYQNDPWLHSRLVLSAKHWVELEDERQYDLLASLVMHSGRVREHATTPYLFCHGPTGTGKNRIGHWLRVLCYRGLLVERPSVASLFWTMERHSPTLIIDEAEKLAPYKKNQGELAEALIEVLNAGYQQGQFIPRVDKERGQLKFYDPFGFKVILSTEDLPDTTKGRCIIINTDENIRQDIPVSHPTIDDPEIAELRRYLESYWLNHDKTSPSYKPSPSTLTFDDLKQMIPNYRAVEKFGPLYHVCPDPLAQKNLLDLAVEDATDRREERGIGQDSEILQALAHAREAETVDRYAVADIAKRFNEGREKWETLSSEQIGRKIRKFGLKPCRGHGGVRMFMWNEAKLQRRFKRYGIVLEQSYLGEPSPTVILSPKPDPGPSQGDSRDSRDSNVRGTEPRSNISGEEHLRPNVMSAQDPREETVKCEYCKEAMSRKAYQAHACPVGSTKGEYSQNIGDYA